MANHMVMIMNLKLASICSTQFVRALFFKTPLRICKHNYRLFCLIINALLLWSTANVQGFAQQSNSSTSPHHCTGEKLTSPIFKLEFVKLIRPKLTHRSSEEAKIYFRLTNKTKCTVHLSTWGIILKNNRGEMLDYVPNGRLITLTYLVDGGWGWGDHIMLYKFRPNYSINFSVPISNLKNSQSIEVPLQSLNDDTPIMSSEVYRVRFNLTNLPANIQIQLKALDNKISF
jgi:hypothetical protein